MLIDEHKRLGVPSCESEVKAVSHHDASAVLDIVDSMMSEYPLEVTHEENFQKEW